MNSRERLLTAIGGGRPDHVPLYCWVFGFTAPPHLRWSEGGRQVAHWYTMRMEHIHTLPQPWGLEQDFKRADRWLSLGLDDVLDVSLPWSVHPAVQIRDWCEPPSSGRPCALQCREYDTPAGVLRHVVRRTEEEQGAGWVVQPDAVELFEDFNIPRGVDHAVVGPEDLAKLRYLLQDPTQEQLAAYRERMDRVRRFTTERGVLVQGWSAYGMDGIVWLCGVEGAIMAAMMDPPFFEELAALMYDFDRRRTEIMLDVGGVDMIVQRGWYSATNFWSPTLFRRFALPRLKELVALTHEAGIRFAYVMTTGLMSLLDELKEAGFDLLYFVDPVQDDVDLAVLGQRLEGRFALAGGVNSGVTLANGSPEEIQDAVYAAIQTLGSDGGFILSPVDALFPDTPWCSVRAMIDAWRGVCDY